MAERKTDIRKILDARYNPRPEPEERKRAPKPPLSIRLGWRLKRLHKWRIEEWEMQVRARKGPKPWRGKTR